MYNICYNKNKINLEDSYKDFYNKNIVANLFNILEESELKNKKIEVFNEDELNHLDYRLRMDSEHYGGIVTDNAIIGFHKEKFLPLKVMGKVDSYLIKNIRNRFLKNIFLLECLDSNLDLKKIIISDKKRRIVLKNGIEIHLDENKFTVYDNNLGVNESGFVKNDGGIVYYSDEGKNNALKNSINGFLDILRSKDKMEDFLGFDLDEIEKLKDKKERGIKDYLRVILGGARGIKLNKK